MSEDVGVKAPVTRLRRRLSIETEDVKSPAGTVTPTKKKGGRLAIKPQLDLIEEIDSGPIPKRSTRKTAVKDIEPAEEKPITPSRRSARIRSNTSILSETSQALDSPRAKRAARRTSQAGSDNDAPITPARVTRRTRKDSTSSIDKPVDKTSTKSSAATEIIVEEQETHTYESDSKDKSINKSPISRGNRVKKNNSSKSSNDTEDDIETKDLNISTNKENQVKNVDSVKSVPKEPIDDSENKDTYKDYDSKVDCNEILTENLDAKSKNNRSILHKSTSAIEDFKSKRHRTISVSAIPTINANDCIFFSDTEISKKKRKNKSLTNCSSATMFAQDGAISKKSNDTLLTPLQKNINKKDDSQNTSANSRKSTEIENNKEIKSNNTSENLNINEETITGHEESINSVLKTGWKKNIINQIQTGYKLDSKTKKDSISPIKCFENAPSKNIQSVVILEDDSDSNAVTNDNIRPVPYLDSEDQCVPVVKHDNQTDSNVIPHDNSYEPMDIDESIQQNTSINKSMKSTPRALNKVGTKNQSLVAMDQGDDSDINPTLSKRKSLLSSFESHNEKSTCESKSTLILSQIKDTSSNEIEKNLSKVNNKEQLSKSINIPDKIKNKEVEKKKLSLDYSTSTPLQQKSMKKLGVPIDTSLISPKNAKTEGKKRKSKESFSDSKKINNDDDSDQSDESGAEITKTQNEIIDDEAEEASEDYESGDSQDSDDRQYEEENRIVEKGETLDTEEEFSDDTDYEKDSFVVSSGEEDNELLTGSGDDLSLSDNELSMSKKSKKKYNEKKIKEQKKASREMFEARHKLDNSNKSMPKSKTKKNNRQRLDSSSSESGEEITVQRKKNNRQRIDSSQDLSGIHLDAHESFTEKQETKQQKRRKQLSESVCDENDLNEQEITICNDNKVEEKDPIFVTIKHEPKTPKKDNNLSAVVIHDNIEEIDVDQNATILKPNETSDPLQVTKLDIDENSSSSEENKEIMDNYNSVLEGLNKKPKGYKTLHNSLNIDKKQSKLKEAYVLIEKLNLTQTKPNKTKKKSVEIESLEKETHTESEHKTPIEKEDDDVSDSINMRLLFTEDSNDSEIPNTDSIKEVSVTSISEDKDFIPLKKTEAKTNLLEDMDTASSLDNSSQLNENKKLQNKQGSSQHIPEENSPLKDTEKNEVSFFIDTTGTRDDQVEPLSVLLSASKKQKKRNSNVTDVQEFSIITDIDTGDKTLKKSLDTEVVIADDIANESEKNTPQSEKKKKKGKKTLNTTEVDEWQNEIGQDAPTDQAKTPQSGKKKHKIWSLDESENILHNVQEEEEQGMSFEIKASSDKKKKRAKKSLSDVQNDQVDEISEELTGEEEQEMSFNIFTSDKKKKKTKKSLNITQNEQVDETSVVSIEEAPQETSFDILTASDKKKAKKSLTNIHNDQVDETSEVPTEQIPQETSFDILTASGKKKKKAKKSLTNIQNEQVNENNDVPTEENPQELSFHILTASDKKKTNVKKSLTNTQNEQVDETSEGRTEQILQETSFDILTASGKKRRKAKKSLCNVQSEQVNETSAVSTEETPEEIPFDILTASNNKKTKTKKSLTNTQNEQVDETSEVPIEQIPQETSFDILTASGKKKKAKKSLTNVQSEQVDEISEVPTEQIPETTSFDTLTESGKKKKKAKKSLTNVQSEQIDETSEVPTEQIPHTTSFDTITDSGKKKQKAKKSLTNVQSEQVDEITLEPTEENPQEIFFDSNVNSDKKKKAKKSLTNIQNDETNEINTEEKEQETSFEGQTGNDKKKKKARKSLDNIQNEQNVETSEVPAEVTQQSKNKRNSSQSNIDTKEIIPLETNKSDPNIDNKEIGSKKRKRKHSAVTDEDATIENIKEKHINEHLNESSTGRQNKKRKINNNSQDPVTLDEDATRDGKELPNLENSKPAKVKKNKHAKQENNQIIDKDTDNTKQKKKRKERDDDDITNVSKMLKQSSFDKAQVTRLPSHILNQLEAKPNKTVAEAKKAKVIATTKFTVENAKIRRNKPSNYLEESVYLNDDTLVEKKQKKSIKKPKVLPFMPTASTSDKGFTTTFRINVLPTETKFIAQASNVTNFKKDFLQQQKMKKFHTFEKYKNQRNVKLSKF